MSAIDDTTIALVDAALAEDVGAGDFTTLWTVPSSQEAVGEIVAKQEGIVAGLAIADAVFRRLNPRTLFDAVRKDGGEIRVGDVVATVRGSARTVLTGERTALNFLQHLSGIATLTRRYVRAVEGTGARILDTRKTLPAWRALEKAAVRAGGGENHRAGLYDMVLLKDNHIEAAGGIAEAIDRIRKHNERGLPVEVEVRSLEELDIALSAGVDRVLLDNMDLDTMRRAVALARSAGPAGTELEASGNMTLERVREVAETGVDLISVGALTHSAPALDLSLRMRAS